MAPRKFPPIDERLWAKVDKDGPVPTHVPHLGNCWLWTGGVCGNGYGAIKMNGKQEAVHRVAWIIQNGEIPEGMQVLHSCDIPLCVRHLFLGTGQDNSRDMVKKGRAASGERHMSRLYPGRLRRGDNHPARLHPETVKRGERHGMAKLKENDVRAIRARFILARPSLSRIAEDYRVTTALIRFIVRGEIWSHVL